MNDALYDTISCECCTIQGVVKEPGPNGTISMVEIRRLCRDQLVNLIFSLFLYVKSLHRCRYRYILP